MADEADMVAAVADGGGGGGEDKVVAAEASGDGRGTAALRDEGA